MLESLFGNPTIEKILFFLLKRERAYARQIQLAFDMSISPIQNALDRLEQGNIIVSFTEGRTRLYTLNPRYPFRKELIELLNRAYEYLPPEQASIYEERNQRKRPRKRNKK